ncbi:PH domain-containing protein [Glaciecola sp. XM2]|jgi:membrane protein YdbS with pleckstrin-like domain|uniref:PH domain-containing protein n=1 Tax=Glaciecola sp. XM2 TaxID=1914931 RepID=UPI001BDF232D|nr:PH domain-containing protein [Glaciecola sp. XM2]MBT1451218.1 PH domain-containing protein [Glaciecola sp. XM2]
MEYSNQTINLDDVSVESLPLKGISTRYRTIHISLTVLVTIIILAVFAFLDSGIVITRPEWMEFLGAAIYGLVLFFALWNILYIVFSFQFIQYAVREQDLHFQSGLFFRKLVSQPILRIQHIELNRGPIERKANLATLQVFSAGGVSHTFEIPGLDYEEAVALRKFIIDHKDLSLDE